MKEARVTVRLFMQVSRDNDGRLGGQVFPVDSDKMHDFSGTLELLKVLEDLVLPDSEDDALKQPQIAGDDDRHFTVPEVPGP
jgi:hypothetical protein